MAEELPAQGFAPLEAGLERDEGFDDLADHLIRLADDGRLRHGRMLHQCTFDLERPDQMAGGNVLVGLLALKRGWPSMMLGYLHEEERYRKCFAGGSPALPIQRMATLPARGSCACRCCSTACRRGAGLKR